MKTNLFTLLFLCVLTLTSKGQYYIQYFDGADTSAINSIIIQIDTNANNIWQIGKPQKIIFDSAATAPNVIVTDTINNYPGNNTSSFIFKYNTTSPGNWTTAIQWKQKLDMNSDHDGGIIEYSTDTGATWHNVFNDPNVYNFFGFDPLNKDTLLNGSVAFSGTDSTWKDVWLCFKSSWLYGITDSLFLRYTFTSDTLNNGKEGWIIDNMNIHQTYIHPVKEEYQKKYLHVYPNPAKDIVNIDVKDINEFHIIKSMKLIRYDGTVAREWNNIPVHYWFYTREFADGNYFLKVKTNIKTETIPIVIKKD